MKSWMASSAGLRLSPVDMSGRLHTSDW